MHYYVYKDGHCLSDYDNYEQAKEHCDLVDGEILRDNN